MTLCNLVILIIFYRNGSRGYLIEPDPNLYNKLKKTRPNDSCLNIGIGNKNTVANLYIMSTNTLNTFSKKEVEMYIKNKSYGEQKIIDVVKIPIVTPKRLVDEYIGFVPDCWSIDTEGYDEKIINSIDFEKHRPKVICIETIRCVDPNEIKKSSKVTGELLKAGYFIYADTFINTILVDSKTWNKKYKPVARE